MSVRAASLIFARAAEFPRQPMARRRRGAHRNACMALIQLLALQLLLVCSGARGDGSSGGLALPSAASPAPPGRRMLQQQAPGAPATAAAAEAAAVAAAAAAEPAPQAQYNGSAVLASYPGLAGASLAARPPAVHGRVNKSGPAERLAWSQAPHYAIAREAIFLDWRQQELARPAPPLAAGRNVTCAAARHPPAPFHHCHVFVNHAYRVAYVRSPKSASSSIMHWLGQCRYNKTRNWNATTCMDYTWERYESPADVAALWRDYFFFGFVRNPWARAFSLFKDMSATNHFLHRHGPRCTMDWGSFCAAPFAEFDRLYGAGCSHKPPHYAYWHMMDQFHCLAAPDGGWAVDFIGRVEAGNEDWRTVVDEMNARRRDGVPAVPYSALEHVHKVEPRAPAGAAAQQAQQARAARAAQQQTRRRRGRRRRRLLDEAGAAAQAQQAPGGPQGDADADDEPEDEEAQLGADHKLVRVFRHLWRRVRSAALLSYSAALSPVPRPAGAPRPGPGSRGGDGPYSGANEHCIDAVSQWFGCDVERFGYLPPLPPPPPDEQPGAAGVADAAAPGAQAAAGGPDAGPPTSVQL